VTRMLVAVGLILMAGSVAAQSGARNGEWRTYGSDLGNTRYSPLDQINASNFNRLELAWHFKTDSLGPRPEFQFEGTPLMVGGMVYSTGGTRRAVVALDAATGEMIWVHSEREGARGAAAPRQLSGRGLAYWSGGPAGGGQGGGGNPGGGGSASGSDAARASRSRPSAITAMSI